MISPQYCLLLGFVLSVIFREHTAFKVRSQKISKYLLQWSVVFMGASLNFHALLNFGYKGLLLTASGILVMILAGLVLSQLMKFEIQKTWLISVGTAICGGSAIASMAPVIGATAANLGMSISVVFLLNAMAVFVFPWLGQVWHLSQEEFGVFAALAIHDTSSVVAAASIYGSKALQVATTLKLVRALWIVPLVFLFSTTPWARKIQVSSSASASKVAAVKVPWFILGFVIMSLLFTFVENGAAWTKTLQVYLVQLAKIGFAFTLFLIGFSFDVKDIKSISGKPLLFGGILWLFSILFALICVMVLHIQKFLI